MLDIISILAGGYSASKYDPQNLPGFVIGVNDAVIYGRCNIGITMDRLWLEARWDKLCFLQKDFWARPAALLNIKDRPKWLQIFECDYQSSAMTDDPNIINGTNSGLCAVGLAYKFCPNLLRIYGLDGSIGPNGQQHWYPDYTFKSKTGGPLRETPRATFQKWKCDLDYAIRQCKEDKGITVEVMR